MLLEKQRACGTQQPELPSPSVVSHFQYRYCNPE